MTIAGIGSSSMAMPSFEEMKAKRQEGLAKLKASSPELAQKVEKIDSRLEELRTSGVDREEAMATVKSEIGELSESERASMDEAFGAPAGAGGRMFEVKNKGMQKMGGGRPPGPPPAGGPGGPGGPGGAKAASGSGETSETDSTDEEADALKEYLKQVMEKAIEEYKASSSSAASSNSEESLSLVA